MKGHERGTIGMVQKLQVHWIKKERTWWGEQGSDLKINLENEQNVDSGDGVRKSFIGRTDQKRKYGRKNSLEG